MASIGMGAVSCKGHPSFVQRASEFRAKGIFTSGYALCMCKLLHRSVRRHGGTSSARRRSFIRGVEKFRISSPALQLHKRTSSARRRSFRRRGIETFLKSARRGACGVVYFRLESSRLVHDDVVMDGIFSERVMSNLSFNLHLMV